MEYSQAHYAAYMVKRADGLRIISLNTNLCESTDVLNKGDQHILDNSRVSVGYYPIQTSPPLIRSNRANYFNYINASHPDTSGMMRFLTDELQAAEDAGDRGKCAMHLELSQDNVNVAWIIGHVPSGWDGTNGLLNPTNLCQ